MRGPAAPPGPKALCTLSSLARCPQASPGLLAVGYGQLEYSVAAPGLVAFFSLANPGQPVWTLATPCGVSALDWSARSGALAAGFFDGSVAVYDVRARNPAPLARVPPTGCACTAAEGMGRACREC